MEEISKTIVFTLLGGGVLAGGFMLTLFVSTNETAKGAAGVVVVTFLLVALSWAFGDAIRMWIGK